MKIEVRPIETKKWHGKTGKESFTRSKKIQALVDPSTNEYATGLTKEDIEKLRDMGITYDLSPNFNQGEPHPFWDSPMATIELKNATMFFDTKKPLDYIKMKILKASKYVANSMKEYEEGLFPEATHVIFDESEEVEIKATKVAIKKKAIIEAAKLSKDRKIALIMILAGKNLKGKSDDFVEVELDKIIERKPKDVLRYIEMDPEKVSLHALVLEALQKSVLRKQGHKILYYDSVIGGDVYDVVSYLQDEENQDLKLRIMSAVN